MDDPAVKFAYEQTQSLQKEISELKQALNGFQETDKQRQVNSRVENEMKAAKNTYKTMFGAEPSEEQMNLILKTMEKSKVYDAALVTKSVFAEQLANERAQRVLNEQKAKREMFSRPTLMNSSTARENEKENMSLEEAFREATREASMTI